MSRSTPRFSESEATPSASAAFASREERTCSSPLLRRCAPLLTAAFVVGVALVSYSQLFGSGNWLALEEDDFFYYLKVASNVAHGQGSTFGGVPTNGYHPLWFLLLTGVSYLPHSASELPIRVFFALCIFVATTATYLLSRKLLSGYLQNPLLVNALAVITSLYAMRLYCSGMEVILTIPLILLLAVLLESPSLWTSASFLRSAALGLLLSAIFLSRLDSVLLLVLLAAGLLLHPRLRLAFNRIGLLAGLLPILLYFVLNHLYFHAWMPVSGAAKQLKPTRLPSWAAWSSLTHANQLVMAIVLLSFLLLPRLFRQLTPARQVLYPVLLLFPFLHLFVISCLSDWRVWPWYLYGLRPALCITFSLFLLWRPSERLLGKSLVTAAVAILSLIMFIQARRVGDPHGFDSTYWVAMQIRQFATTHPGRYAMGDRAGIVAYLLPDPLLQTEGLMADQHLLNLIRNRANLTDALAQYHVDYYIATSDRPFPGCFQAIEPAQAGPDSPHMAASLCTPPLADFVYGPEHTFIFGLRPSSSSPR